MNRNYIAPLAPPAGTGVAGQDKILVRRAAGAAGGTCAARTIAAANVRTTTPGAPPISTTPEGASQLRVGH